MVKHLNFIVQFKPILITNCCLVSKHKLKHYCILLSKNGDYYSIYFYYGITNLTVSSNSVMQKSIPIPCKLGQLAKNEF